jgi:NodT family efflux transporter outer membrane factor (OMF) lipoprotein
MKNMKMIRPGLALAASLTLTACALSTPPSAVTQDAPLQWQAPLPHDGNVQILASWWQGLGDPLLVNWIEQAQIHSPTVAAAGARIAQSQAERVAAGAALLPALNASASANRMSQQSALPMGTTTQAALQASWEIDLFGTRRFDVDAAQTRLAGASAGWHEARVSVAAEVASQYYNLRACQRLLEVALQDASSRADTARLTALSAAAGFQAPASSALARASAAEGRSRATGQRALCDLDVKALVALSAVPEPQLRRELQNKVTDNAADNIIDSATEPALAIAALPAQTLSQRPDVYGAERAVAAASADIGSAQAQRYPRLSLSGLVGAANFRSAGTSTSLTAWSIGPLALTLPLFDGGTRRANVDAAVARYDQAVIQYRASVRQAVREVETALVNLDSSAQRSVDAQVALEGYRAFFVASDSRYRNGLANLLDLEDARRTRLAAENAVINLQRERRLAWVALYRAAGGGWVAP